MAKHQFRRGVSGNPNGRPPKSRALTDLLERGGAQKMIVKGDEFIERRKLLAEHLWTAVTEGEVTLPNGETLTFAPKDWLETVKFLYHHIDGPAKPVQPEGSENAPARVKKMNYDEIADNDPAELLQLYRQEIG